MVTLKNRRRVQNHIGGIHACGMALAAESATGIVVGMNVPDTAIPLCKSIKINFVRRCEGEGVCGVFCVWGGGFGEGGGGGGPYTHPHIYTYTNIQLSPTNQPPTHPTGDIKAVAHLTEEQLTKIHTEEKGDVLVNVEVGGGRGGICVMCVCYIILPLSFPPSCNIPLLPPSLPPSLLLVKTQATN